MSGLPQSVIDRVKDCAKIDEIVGDYIQLKKSGRNLVACCPFHHERTPSFFVSKEGNFFKCFGCGESGDTISFIEKIEDVDFVGAVKMLAKRYGIEVENDEQSGHCDVNTKESAFIITNHANKFFRQNFESDSGSIARLYVKSRGINTSTLDYFSIGYSLPSWDSWYKYSCSIGCNVELQNQIGLISGNNKSYYDCFRNRLMIPIYDLSGKVLAFAGRLLDNTIKEAKYINSAESFLYHKGGVLYGLYQAKKSIRQLNKCYLVEGYFDVISLWQAGVTNVVASSGTSLTDDQCKLLYRFTKNVTVFYDGDDAGIHATKRAIEKLLSVGFSVNVVSLPTNDDPDSFVRMNGDACDIEKTIGQYETDFVAFLVNKELNGGVELDITRKNQIVKDAIKVVSLIRDSVYRSLSIHRIKSILQLPDEVKLCANGTCDYKLPEKPVVDIIVAYERELLRYLVTCGSSHFQDGSSVAEYIISEMNELVLVNSDDVKIINLCKELLKIHGIISPKNLMDNIDDEHLKCIVVDMCARQYELSKKCGGRMFDESNDLHGAIKRNIMRLKLRLLRRVLNGQMSLLRTLKDYESTKDVLEIISDLKTREMIISKKLGMTIV